MKFDRFAGSSRAEEEDKDTVAPLEMFVDIPTAWRVRARARLSPPLG